MTKSQEQVVALNHILELLNEYKKRKTKENLTILCEVVNAYYLTKTISKNLFDYFCQISEIAKINNTNYNRIVSVIREIVKYSR